MMNMKKYLMIAVCCGLALASGLAARAAGAPDALTSLSQASKALAELPNYSWSLNIIIEGMPFSPGIIYGKTQKGGYAHLKTEINGQILETAIKDYRKAITTPSGWVAAREFKTPMPKDNSKPDPAAMVAQLLLDLQSPDLETEKMLGKIKTVKPGKDGCLVAEVAEDVAREVMAPNRQMPGISTKPPPPKSAKSVIRFWIKDGLLVKSEIEVKLIVIGQPGKKDRLERKITKHITTEIKDIGKTTVLVPEDAKRLLK